MKLGSLFTGIGGFDLGFERAGGEVAWQCEIDANARRVLAAHWPEVPCYKDVKEVGYGAPVVDVVVGGFPCQDVSVAGRRAGLAGERSGLWFEFRRVLEELAPAWVVIENVPGLLSSNRGRDFAVILQGLAELGYGVAWRVLDAQHFGVAQRRRRVFIVGHLGDGRAAEVLFEPESLSGNPPARRTAREGVAGTLVGGSPGGSSHGKPSGSDRGNLVVADPVTAFVTQPRYVRNGRGAPSPIAYPLTAEAGRTGKGDSAQIVFDPTQASHPLVAGSLDTQSGSGKLTTQSAVNGHLVLDTMTARMNVALGARDIEEGAVQADAHGLVRRLTPTECERLQGFPDGWTAVAGDIERRWVPGKACHGGCDTDCEHGTWKEKVLPVQADSHRYRQLGNAVAVPVIEWIARRIVEVDAQ